MKRRSFIKGAGMSLGMMALLQNQGIASMLQSPYKMTLLRKDVGMFTERGGTIGWMVNKEGIVVVDSQFADTAAHVIEELKKKSGKPFRYLINTHHHGDHTGGNIAFKGISDHVIAHANCLINHRATALAQKSEEKQLFADTVFNDRWKTKVGSEAIHAQYFGAGHTNGDAIIHFEDANIAHMGDLMFNRRFPFIDRAAGANIRSWIQVLDKTLSTFDSDTLFIFGHSLDPEKLTGNKEDIKAMQNYLEKLLLFVGNAKKAGKQKEEILKATVIPGAEDFKGQGIERSLTAAYDELSS
ncbi:MAG: MBL fold metallo-hydrolase [Daejeonella sp.]|uniref:MBL fold metallo-hydrolase n=1 Tax=Daejeonella sp. TaxID=2805397 RepID=UPI003C7469B0